MPASDDLQTALNHLPAEDRQTLVVALPYLMGLVAQIDGKVSFWERVKIMRAVAKAPAVLGGSFKELYTGLDPERVKTRLVETLHKVLAEEAARLNAVLEKTPEEFRQKYKDFLAQAAVEVAEASGGLQEEERKMLKHLFTALGVPMTPERWDKVTIRQ